MIAPPNKKRKVSMRGARRRLEVRAEAYAQAEVRRIMGEWTHINHDFSVLLGASLQTAFLSGGVAVLEEVKGLVGP